MATIGRMGIRLAVGLLGFVVLMLALDGLGGVVQPRLDPAAEGVLRTFDENGRVTETRLAVVVDDDGVVWVQSGHHFRGWYARLQRNPRVELVRAGRARAYRAVPMPTDEARAHVVALLKQRTGSVGFYAIRTGLLFAEIRPVRLDPR